MRRRAPQIDQRCRQGRIEEDNLRAELLALDDLSDDFEPCPVTVRHYQKTVRELRAKASRETVAGNSPAAGEFRNLIAAVTLIPAKDRESAIVEINGRLHALSRKSYERSLGSSGVTMVAEASYERPGTAVLPLFSVRVPLRGP